MSEPGCGIDCDCFACLLNEMPGEAVIAGLKRRIADGDVAYVERLFAEIAPLLPSIATARLHVAALLAQLDDKAMSTWEQQEERRAAKRWVSDSNEGK